MRALLSLILLSGPAWAGDCPPAPDHGARLAALIAAAQAAATEPEARRITDDMWALWTDAPDARAQELLNAGMERRAAYDFAGAARAFDALVAYCPDYAEGYNQRAFVAFLRQDYAAALEDLERALALTPDHIPALAGKALTLMGLGRMDEGQAVLRAALALNPWLPERGLLIAAPGKDI
ncbi:tetratricopeptide repeat protein [Actibacterium sp. MT2.3-13A]|uniref:tetratricopeptide repeat protein n=1 Tax=Actibacterium sp. MT2.3-13A TaxID=2828332 RepID=UPI001BAC88AA|nr:tetratricopeptide repeat protein [Actibacterium sp. MT2.3-13A]